MSMTEQLDVALKQSMRDRDRPLSTLIRMLKSRMTEKTTSKGFTGEVNDALWLEVISSYAKAQSKAIEQFRAAGEKGVEHVVGLEWELKTLAQWLPTKADEATTAAWVAEVITALGTNAKFGQVMGAVMKAHKADVDAGVVRKMVTEALK